jgi:hypothetical protein
MKIVEFEQNKLLVPDNLSESKKIARRRFIRVTILRMLKEDAAFKHPTKANEVSDNKDRISEVQAKLKLDIADTSVIYEDIHSKVMDSPDHLPIKSKSFTDDLDKRRLIKRYVKLGSPERMRESMILSIVWKSISVDNLLKLGKQTVIDNLHYLVDRRIRIAERMLYDVGYAPDEDRAWDKDIGLNPKGPWKDGWNRIFEYPRVRQKRFLKICDPHPGDGHCKIRWSDGHTPSLEPYIAWFKVDSRDIKKLPPNRYKNWMFTEDRDKNYQLIKTNNEAENFWKRPDPPDPQDYLFFFDMTKFDDVEVAINSLFTPSDDFMKRNHFFCDHVIYILHLEELLFALKKRGLVAGLKNKLHFAPENWLRIDNSWEINPYTKEIHLREIGLGKILSRIVFPKNKVELIHDVEKNIVEVNYADAVIKKLKEHPGDNFEKLDDVEKALGETETGVGKILSRIVFPKNKVELIHDVEKKKDEVGWFLGFGYADAVIKKLKEHPGDNFENMADVEKALGEERYLVNPNEKSFFEHIEIRESELQVGDHVRVWNHPAYEKMTVEGAWRLENAIVVQTIPKLILQGHGLPPLGLEQMKVRMIDLFNHALVPLQNKVKRLANSIKDDQPTDGDGMLTRRFTDTESRFAPEVRYADWWLRWVPTEQNELAVAFEPDLRLKAQKVQKIDYVPDKVKNVIVGLFPLWVPSKPVPDHGKIRKVDPLIINTEAIEPWAKVMDPSKKDLVKVIRPRV